jgi:hypothetical protein
MYCNERFECLDLVGEDWLPGRWSAMFRLFQCAQGLPVGFGDLHFHALPERGRALMIPRVYNTCTDMLACCHCELRLNVSEVADVRFGETSSMLVALRMLMASSDSCLAGSLAFTSTS